MAKHPRDFLRVKKHAQFQTQPALHGNLVAANDLPHNTLLPRGERANSRPALLGRFTARGVDVSLWGAVGALSLRPSGLDRRERSKSPQLTLASGPYRYADVHLLHADLLLRNGGSVDPSYVRA